MSYGPEVNRLAVLWQAQPTSSCFAALAEALRKRGALEQATAVAAAGVASRPDYLPGRVVMARIYADQGEWQAADAELREALALDPSHPLVLESLEQLGSKLSPSAATDATPALAGAEAPVDAPVPVSAAFAATTEPPGAADAILGDEYPPEDDGDGRMIFAPAALDDEEPPEPEPVLTESLAMLYHGQGHLEDAVGVLDALVALTPENRDLVARRDAIRAELAVARPLPYDVATSGGRPVRDWLSALAGTRAVPEQPSSGFDAFYQAPSAPPTDTGDLEAFQAWLRELAR